MLESLVDNIDGQQRILAAVAARSTLTKSLPAVAAYSLGVIPLARDADLVTFAAFPEASPDIVKPLERHYGRPARIMPFDENVMSLFLDRIYLKGDSLNLNTFRSPDFLEDPTEHEKLFSAKVEEPEAAGSKVAAGEIVMADLDLWSEIRNLDRPHAPGLDEYRLDHFEPAFRRDGDRWIVWASKPLDRKVSLFLQISEAGDGDDFMRRLYSAPVEAWPWVIFKSEVQVLSVARDGRLQVYVDGVSEFVGPGESRELKTEYHLVRFGNRFRRRLTLTVRGVWKIPRERLEYETPFRGAGGEELRRWIRVG